MFVCPYVCLPDFFWKFRPKILSCLSHNPWFSDVWQTTQNFPMFVTQPKILLCLSHIPKFSNVCHTTQNSPLPVSKPRILQCLSQNPKFSHVCHTTQNSPMSVIHSKIFRCLSHKPQFSHVCHTTQDSPMSLIKPNILWCLSNYHFYIPFQLFFLSIFTIFGYFFLLSCRVMSKWVKKKKLQKVMGNSVSTHQIRPVCKMSCF